MGFRFEDTTIDVEIEGKTYKIDACDSEMQDRLVEAADLAAAFDPSRAGDQAYHLAASEKLRGIVAAILGAEAAEAVFAGRRPNIMQEVQLILYLRRAIDDAEPTKRFMATINAMEAVIGADD